LVQLFVGKLLGFNLDLMHLQATRASSFLVQKKQFVESFVLSLSAQAPYQ